MTDSRLTLSFFAFKNTPALWFSKAITVLHILQLIVSRSIRLLSSVHIRSPHVSLLYYFCGNSAWNFSEFVNPQRRYDLWLLLLPVRILHNIPEQSMNTRSFTPFLMCTRGGVKTAYSTVFTASLHPLSDFCLFLLLASTHVKQFWLVRLPQWKSPFVFTVFINFSNFCRPAE